MWVPCLRQGTTAPLQACLEAVGVHRPRGTMSVWQGASTRWLNESFPFLISVILLNENMSQRPLKSREGISQLASSQRSEFFKKELNLISIPGILKFQTLLKTFVGGAGCKQLFFTRLLSITGLFTGYKKTTKPVRSNMSFLTEGHLTCCSPTLGWDPLCPGDVVDLVTFGLTLPSWVGAHLSLLLYPFDTPSSHLKPFLAFWYDKMPRAPFPLPLLQTWDNLLF